MSKKNLSVLTFMSWDNEDVRAIALCDQTGYFEVAINCMRDGDMGVKDSNGVYSRKWWGDYINNGYVENVSEASKPEINLYLDYVSLEEAVGSDHMGYGKYKVLAVCGHHVVIEYIKPSLCKRFLNLFKKDKMPF